MKSLMVLLLLVSPVSHAGSINLEKFDHIKLAEFLGRLPRAVRLKNVTKSSPEQGMRIENTFPDNGQYPFSMKCTGTYYNRSAFMSAADCSITFDETSAQFQRSHDELKLVITDPELVNGIREATPEGKLLKEFRSYEKRLGYTFAGAWAWIFDYYFSCTTKECVLKLSMKK